MRNVLIMVNVLLFVLLLALCSNAYIGSIENAKEIKEQRKVTDRKIELLEREIHVLRTDMDILQNGFTEK